MKRSIIMLLLVTGAMWAGCSETKQEDTIAQTNPMEAVKEPERSVVEQDTIKGSIASEATGKIGNANIKINYYAPGVKGRIIWGGLVPFDQVWVTGAHMATTIEFDRNLLIDGQEVLAGKYALFTIPGKDEWTVIINKNWKQHLADDYSQKDDVLRVNVKPTIQNQHQERLQFNVKQSTDNKGLISLAWGDLQVSVPVSTNR